MSDLATLEVEGGIATLRLDRPPMNAIDAELADRVMELAREASERQDVYGVVVWGGEKVFAAGADVKEMAQKSYAEMADYSLRLQEFARSIARIPKPTVAAVTGYALGGGLELALACDFRVVGRNAKLGQPEVLLGIIPGAGGTQRLARLVGPARAKDIVFSGRFVSADEALSIGLVDEVVEAEDVYAAARVRLAQFVGGPSAAIRAAKESIDRGLEVDLQTGLEIERMLFHGLFATRDREIGMQSFIENGPGKAKFEGR